LLPEPFTGALPEQENEGVVVGVGLVPVGEGAVGVELPVFGARRLPWRRAQARLVLAI
jgi:hypothetical protein